MGIADDIIKYSIMGRQSNVYPENKLEEMSKNIPTGVLEGIKPILAQQTSDKITGQWKNTAHHRDLLDMAGYTKEAKDLKDIENKKINLSKIKRDLIEQNKEYNNMIKEGNKLSKKIKIGKADENEISKFANKYKIKLENTDEIKNILSDKNKDGFINFGEKEGRAFLKYRVNKDGTIDKIWIKNRKVVKKEPANPEILLKKLQETENPAVANISDINSLKTLLDPNINKEKLKQKVYNFLSNNLKEYENRIKENKKNIREITTGKLRRDLLNAEKDILKTVPGISELKGMPYLAKFNTRKDLDKAPSAWVLKYETMIKQFSKTETQKKFGDTFGIDANTFFNNAILNIANVVDMDEQGQTVGKIAGMTNLMMTQANHIKIPIKRKRLIDEFMRNTLPINYVKKYMKAKDPVEKLGYKLGAALSLSAFLQEGEDGIAELLANYLTDKVMNGSGISLKDFPDIDSGVRQLGITREDIVVSFLNFLGNNEKGKEMVKQIKKMYTDSYKDAIENTSAEGFFRDVNPKKYSQYLRENFNINTMPKEMAILLPKTEQELKSEKYKEFLNIFQAVNGRPFTLDDLSKIRKRFKEGEVLDTELFKDFQFQFKSAI